MFEARLFGVHVAYIPTSTVHVYVGLHTGILDLTVKWEICSNWKAVKKYVQQVSNRKQIKGI